ncbi:MAG: bacterial transcriptional activator domain-containing protein [Phycisphaerales bacterium]
MKPLKNIIRFIRNAPVKTTDVTNTRVLDKMHAAYDDSAHGHTITDTGGHVARLAVAAAILVVAGALVSHLARLAGGNVAWAEVTRQFKAVPFFSVSIYMKENATAEPTQMELWMSQDGRIRLRKGTQVVFAHGGWMQAYDVKLRQPVELDEMAKVFIERIGRAEEFSLDAIIEVMFGGETTEVTPLVNPDAVISEDMVVFDVTLPDTPQWVRIWALRESRLPVRITIWDPRDGETTDAIFTYSREQPKEFFDPNAFQTLLENHSTGSQVNVAYAFLTDPGGRNITPEEMFAQSGYHIPQVEQAGITPDGAVWVIAAKGGNRMPNGHTFFGFTNLRDDLGREYRKVYAAHRAMTDQSVEVFVPAGYPFDEQVPGKLILVCDVDNYDPRAKRETIGTLELTDWAKDTPWPEGTIDGSEPVMRIQMAGLHADAERFEQADRILATVADAPQDSPVGRLREQFRLKMLTQQGRHDEAAILVERLLPLLEAVYREPGGSVPNPKQFAVCMTALVCAGRLDEAKHAWRRIKSIEPELDPKLGRTARTHAIEMIRHGFENLLLILVPELSRKAHLTIAQLNDIFGIDIKKDELFKNETFWDWNPELEKPQYRTWQKHLTELGQHYQNHPLPESMEILAHAGNEEYAGYPAKMPGIDGYEVLPLQGTLVNQARFYRYPESAGRVRIEPGIADVTLDHDLVYRVGTPWLQIGESVLDFFGLKAVEVNEPRRVWIARYDGRALKDYGEVLAPVPHGANPTGKTGTASSASAVGFGVTELFHGFMADQDKDVQADGILIVDETGIRDKLSREVPCWAGPAAIEMARQWFADEFGIAFTEQTRTMTTYVIRPER